jgi:hypothetical protein
MLVAASLAAAAPASATLLLGQTVEMTYLYPDTSVYDGPYDNVVGTTGTTLFYGVTAATPSDTALTITLPGLSGATNYAGAGFNGIWLTDIFGTIDAFTSVTVNGLTNVAGFDASRISFDANNIWLNFQGLPVDPDSIMKVDINGSVPEPASWALLIVGFALMGGALRRREARLA